MRTLRPRDAKQVVQLIMVSSYLVTELAISYVNRWLIITLVALNLM